MSTTITTTTIVNKKNRTMPIDEKIKTRKAHCAVIGMGYVGLPLAVEFANAGFKVVGFDTDKKRISQINDGKSYIKDVDSTEMEKLVETGRLKATADPDFLADMDTVNICVPTPLRKTKDPDISYIVKAAQNITKYLHSGQLIILESTTYPGTTRELLLPMFERTGLKAGEDFYLAFSPERIDPGNAKYQTKNIPKVVGGITPECTRVAALFYQQSIDTIIPVSNEQVAEMVKLLENTFRSVNIGLVNELALMCDKLKIDVWEVIDAAATKPFGFMPFYPGPGLGGHCIPIDPFYLSWRAKSFGFEARFIELAGHVNSAMPEYVISKITDGLNLQGKPVKGSKILICGVAYKANVDDLRESPALDIIKLLQEKGAEVSFSDPHIDSLRTNGKSLKSVPLSQETISKTDCIVIATAHSSMDYEAIYKYSSLIIDTRNVYKDRKSERILKI